jgi:hypothetical protein
MIMGNSPEEMVKNGMDHVMASHPDMAAKIQAMTKEATDNWMLDFQKGWDALPDMPADMPKA